MSSPASPATSEPLPKSLSEHAYDLFVRRGILAGSTRWTESTLHQLADTIEALAYAYIREQTKSNGSNSTNSDPLPTPPTPDPFDAKLAENVAKHEADRKPTVSITMLGHTHQCGKLHIQHQDTLTDTQRRIVEVGARLIDTLLRKNADYGNSAHTPPLLAPDCTSEQGLRVRMSDKLMRITQLVQRPAQVADEAIEDTILDVAGYCLLYLTLPKPEGQNLPKEKLAKLRERCGELKIESSENVETIDRLLDEAKEKYGMVCEIPSKYLTTHDITNVSSEQVRQEIEEIKQREADNLRRQELARAVARSVSPSRSYAECTGQTEEQVAADAEKARTYNPATDHTKPLPPRWVQPVPAPGEYDWSKLCHGVYRIFWKTGGHSVAAVGSDKSGRRWCVPTNWIFDGGDLKSPFRFDWTEVRDVRLIATQDDLP
jgi:hypothetical protein